jgi:hypothetical protein
MLTTDWPCADGGVRACAWTAVSSSAAGRDGGAVDVAAEVGTPSGGVVGGAVGGEVGVAAEVDGGDVDVGGVDVGGVDVGGVDEGEVVEGGTDVAVDVAVDVGPSLPPPPAEAAPWTVLPPQPLDSRTVDRTAAAIVRRRVICPPPYRVAGLKRLAP